MMRSLFGFVSVCLCFAFQVSAATVKSDIESFRAKHDESLRKNWLTLVGLDWLKNDENRVGSAPGSAVHLPTSAPGHLAKITKTGEKEKSSVSIEFIETKNVLIDGKPAKGSTKYEMKADTTANTKPTKVNIDSVEFLLIERSGALGIRIRDQNNVALKTFAGARWYPTENAFKIDAKYVRFREPRTVKYQDVLNNTHEEKINGHVEFAVDGQKVTLLPVSENNGLEFIFRDATSGKDSYGAARYLSTAKPDDHGKVLLDFNKAVNPPCAYTSFATCPLAPAENNLRVAIRAGEMKPLTSKH